MNFEDVYEEKEVIGRGNFGTVYTGTAVLVTHRTRNSNYVAKKINIAAMSPKDQKLSKQEAEVLNRLNHPHIVCFEETFLEKGELIIIMEYCSQGDLAKFIKHLRDTGDSLPEKYLCSWFVQLAMTLMYLHTSKIIHRDIKSSNVYLTDDGTVKLGDFGIARVLEYTQDVAQTVVGTPYYMSPEICQNKPYTYKSDVWSLGVLLYEMCCLRYPFTSNNNIMGLIRSIINDTPAPIPSEYSQGIAQGIQLMLEKDMDSRASLVKVLSIPIFKSYYIQIKSSDLQAKLRLPLPQKKEPVAEAKDDEILGISLFLPYRYDESLLFESAAETTGSRTLEFIETKNSDLLTYSVTHELTDTVFPDLIEETKEETLEERGNELLDELRNSAKQELGKEVYTKLYTILKKLRESNTSDDLIRNEVEEALGTYAADNFYLVDQVIYFESKG